MAEVTEYYEDLTFVPDKRHNKYSEIMANFLTRQLLLQSHFDLITTVPFLDQLNMFGQLMTLRHFRHNKMIMYKHFLINKGNKNIQLRLFKNSIALSLIAQSLENFETLMKDIYRKRIELKIKDKAVQTIAMKQIPRTNKDLIKLLKLLFPSTNLILTDKFWDRFNVIENVRHCVVHSDQIIRESMIKDNGISKGILNEYFILKKRKDARYKLFIERKQGRDIFQYFNYKGFDLFQLVSKDSKQKIKYKIERFKKPEPLTKEAVQKGKELLKTMRTRKMRKPPKRRPE